MRSLGLSEEWSLLCSNVQSSARRTKTVEPLQVFLKQAMLIQVRCQLQHSLKCSSAESVHSMSCAVLLVFSGLQGSSFSFLLKFTGFFELGECHFYCLHPSSVQKRKAPLLRGFEMNKIFLCETTLIIMWCGQKTFF